MMQIRFLMDYSKIEQRCLGSPAYAELASIHTYLLCVQYVMTYVRHLSVYYAIISFFGIWTAVSVAYIRGSRYIIAVLIMTTVLALCALVATLAAKIAAGYESNASFCAIL